MKWAEKFGWGIGSRFIAAFLKAVKKKQQHEIIYEEEIDALTQIINPYDNYRVVWKQNRIDILMTLITEEENEYQKN